MTDARKGNGGTPPAAVSVIKISTNSVVATIPVGGDAAGAAIVRPKWKK